MIARTIQFILATLLIICCTTLLAQDDNDNQCASGTIYNQLIDEDPIFQRSMFYLNRRILEMHEEMEAREDEIYTIPVVVHVIHEGENLGDDSNISDAQVFSAIEALNEDFRKIAGTNGDGDGVDVGIEFCLAVRDPNGNATNGIVRVDGSVVANYADQGIEASGNVGADEGTVKALSTWDRLDYLNIWVVNEIEDNNAQSGVQGYAYFPMNSPLDGIVMLYNAFGTVGNLKPNTDMNRTLTHEVGHYIGLYHTFHSTTSCATEANCETGGDKVCDTPVTTLSASCSSPACSGTQQVENYMDYTSETCRNMFTDGQKERMRATLLASRPTILDSFGCVVVSDNDAGIASIQQPVGSVCSGTFNPEVVIVNYGGDALSSLSIHYGVDGNTNNTFEWTGTLNSGNSMVLTLDEITTTVASHSFDIYCENPSGLPDENTGNDSLTNDFTVAEGAGLNLAVTVDYFGLETTWQLKDDDDNLISSGGPYINYSQGTVFNESICVNPGCYTLTMFDEYGDGMSFTTGNYALTDGDGAVLANGGANFGAFQSHDFCIEEVVVSDPPNANFTVSANGVCEGGELDFTDSSTGEVDGWAWTISGGSPSTSTQANPQNIDFNTPGTYTITLVVSNAQGSDSHSQSITVYDSPTVSLNAVNASCYGTASGQVNSTASGNGSLDYNWSNGSSAVNLTGISAGSYTLTVVDDEGCEASASATVNQPSAIAVNATSTNAACNGDDTGGLSVSATGGTGGFSYSWSNGSSSSSQNNVSAGSYSVTAIDGNGCQASASVSVNEPSAIVINLNEIDIACGAAYGSASVNPSGGAGNYTVTWSTNANGTSISNLSTGDYSVTVSDANGCSALQEFEIIETSSLSISFTIDEISCNGLTDGLAVVSVNGGSGNYTYAWSTGHTYLSIGNLGPGTYSISVSDDQGCEGYEEFTLTSPPPMALTLFKTDISCHGLVDGTATASVSGGTGSYNYDWSNGQHNASISGLAAGLHSLTAGDANGCVASGSITIVEPSAISSSVEVTQNETCAGSDGSAVINAMGGTGNYTYSWSNGASGQTATSLSAGVYSVSTIDGNGCVANTSATIEYDCEINVPPTKLVASDCNGIDFHLEDYISCEVVAGAEMYQWKFQNAAVGIWTEEYTIGSNPNFQLSAIGNLYYGVSVSVSVKALISGAWGNYGEVCSITMADDIPVTQLVDSDCGAQNVQFGDILQTESVSGADEYEWLFTALNYQNSFISYTPMLTISDLMGFDGGTDYHVQVRALVGPTWSQWGAQCTITMGSGNGLPAWGDGTPVVTIYPNPGFGEKIIIEFGNLNTPVHVSEFELYTLSGGLIETFKLSDEFDSLTRTEHQFENTLAAGMYLLRYSLNERTFEEKLIVR
jgi:PKD repeat protein